MTSKTIEHGKNLPREVNLTRGKVALVDNDDFDRVDRHRWVATYKSRGEYCAERASAKRVNGTVHLVSMQRFIVGIYDKSIVIEHINGHTLDNRKENLRIRAFGRTSAFSGVIFRKDTGKWHSRIRINGKQRHLGSFDNNTDAHLEYVRAFNEKLRHVPMGVQIVAP